jgi:hypothetical protein
MILVKTYSYESVKLDKIIVTCRLLTQNKQFIKQI